MMPQTIHSQIFSTLFLLARYFHFSALGSIDSLNFCRNTILDSQKVLWCFFPNAYHLRLVHLLTFEPKGAEGHPMQILLPGWGCTLDDLLLSNSSINCHYNLENIQMFCDFPLFGFSSFFVGRVSKKSELEPIFQKTLYLVLVEGLFMPFSDRTEKSWFGSDFSKV